MEGRAGQGKAWVWVEMAGGRRRVAGWLVSVDATRKVVLKVCVSGSYARQRGPSLPWGTPESIVFGAIETHIFFVWHDSMP